MKFKRCLKRITATSLAFVVALSAVPHHFISRADSDDYPEEIMFPIQVLDFRQDNLFFEYNDNHFDLYEDASLGQGNDDGTGLVELNLNADGTPQYTQKTVERIAEYVQDALENMGNRAVLDNPDVNGELNYLSMRNYIKSEIPTIEVLGTTYANKYKNGADIAEGAEYVQWDLADGAAHTYDIGYTPQYGAGYWPVVWDMNGDNRTALYTIEYNGLQFIEPGKSYTQTFSDLVGDYRVSIGRKSDKTKVLVNGAEVNDGDVIKPNDAGQAQVTLSVGDIKLSDWYRIEAEDCTLKQNGTVDMNRGKYVGYIGGEDDNKIVCNFYSSQEGVRVLRIYYGSEKARDLNVIVNGVATTLKDLNGGNWDSNWVNTQLTIDVKKGYNTIEFSGVNNAFAPNIDAIEIQKDTYEYASSPINDNGWINMEAEDATLSGTAFTTNGPKTSGGKYVASMGHGENNKVTFTVNSASAGNRDMNIYYMSAATRSFDVKVNNGEVQKIQCEKGSAWDEDVKMTKITIELQKGKNTIEIGNADAYAPNLDRIEIGTELAQYKIEDVVLDPVEKTYPLGDYKESQTKYETDANKDGVSDYGWTDIKTCMDYAYFMTRNLFKYHSTLNEQYDKYEYLVFHEIDDDGKVAYEFAADQHHDGNETNEEKNSAIPVLEDGTPNPDYNLNYAEKGKVDLIFNSKDNKTIIGNNYAGTIRNASDTDAGDTTKGDVVKDGGSMFVCDDANKTYPEIDKNHNNRNYHYTISSKTKFVYKKDAGQYFYFSGDDDVYVFVNGKLLVDLGGAHMQLDGEFNLDNLAKERPDLGLVDGQEVDFAFFYIERHTTASNFYAKLNFKLATDVLEHVFEYETIPYGFLVDLTYSFTSNRELNTNTNMLFTDNFGNIIGSTDFVLGKEVVLKNNSLDVIVTDMNGQVSTYVDENGVTQQKIATFNFGAGFNPSEITEAQKKQVMDFFANLKISKGETLQISGPQFDTSKRQFSDYTETADPSTRTVAFEPSISYDASMLDAPPTHGTLTKTKIVSLIVGNLSIQTEGKVIVDGKEVPNMRDKLSYYDFTVTRGGIITVDGKDMDIGAAIKQLNSTALFYDNRHAEDSEEEKKQFAEKVANGDIVVEPNIDLNTEYEFKSVTLNKVPIGEYTITLDPKVLTGYTVDVSGKMILADGTEKEAGKVVNDNGTVSLVVPFVPEYDKITKTWTYPKLVINLSATRETVKLKDLT